MNYDADHSVVIIPNAHMVFASKESKALNKQCTELAQLFSVTISFPKTGVVSKIPSHLLVKEYPNFIEK